jgi:glycosyltransferase involved in cell wall biosynthesis
LALIDVGAIDLTIVVPAFNEGGNVGVVIERSLRTLDAGSFAGAFEIIVVDDGSTDETWAIADGVAAREPRVIVVRRQANGGFGAAVRDGYALARGTYVTIIPADGEVDVEEALKLLAIVDGADVVVSRRLRDLGQHREWLTRSFHWLTRRLTGFDPTGMDGIFVIRRDVLQQIPLHSTTGLVNNELLMHCVRRRCTMRSGTMQTNPRISGVSKVVNARTMAKILWELLTLRWLGGTR